MEKPKIREVIVVEGRYDKNTLSQVVDAHIIETCGFGIFSDRELLELIRRLAAVKGVIIMTDGDGAGLVIRNYIKGAVKDGRVLHAYIPDISGKEKRKTQPSREGKLGVEGMSRETIIGALKAAGATFADTEREVPAGSGKITKTDLYTAGLSGHPHSGIKRKELLKRLKLPENMSANALLQALNSMYSYEELIALLNPPDTRSQ